MYLRKLFACLIIASMLTAALPVTTLADSNSQKNFAQALGIRAPQIIEVNQSFTLQTIEKHKQKAEPNVAVYAVKATDLNRSSSDNNTSNATTIMNAYADIAKKIGTFLGNTDTNGQLSCTLANSQQYILIAIKDGFIPGFTRINVVLAPKKSLQINAPNIAESGQQVSITVTERPAFRPVTAVQKDIIQKQGTDIPKTAAAQILPIRPIPAANASVYAIKATLAEGIVAQAYSKTNHQVTDNYTALVKEKGFFIGTTDAKGRLYYTFSDIDRYVLIAIKDAYAPGFTRINIILAEKKALRLNAVESALIGQPVTIAVTEKAKLLSTPKTITDAQPNPAQTTATQKIIVQPVNREVPVAGARIYALPLSDSTILSETLTNADGTINTTGEKYLELAKNRFIGTTNADGKLITTFTDSGSYLIIAIKDGFRPDFRRIRVNQPNLRESNQLNLREKSK